MYANGGCTNWAAILCAGLMVTAWCAGASAQQPAAPTAEMRPAEQENLFGRFGRWLNESISGVASGLKDAGARLGDVGGRATEVAKGPADAAKEAAGTIARIPNTAVVSGRAHCVRAENGGPDCTAATVALCRSKGYATGRPIEVISAHKCSPERLAAGASLRDVCRPESYVTRAICQ
jgi:hypothetical protein